MTKKYEFDSQEQANDLLAFYLTRRGEKRLHGAAGFIELGHIQLSPPVMDGDEQIEAATFSAKWAVDVSWKEIPEGLEAFEVTPTNPIHKF